MKRSPIARSRQFQPTPSCFMADLSVGVRAGAGALAQHIEPAAIGAFDTPLFAKVKVYFRVPQRAATAIAGDAVGIDSDDFKRLGHNPTPLTPAHDSRRC